MIDLSVEQGLPLAQAVKCMPTGRGGSTPHVSTLTRWIMFGAKGPNGETVRLEALRLGTRWITSVEALQRFAERLTPVLKREPAPAPRTPKARERASDRAARELAAAGI